jgi:hypothetical protein
MAISAEQLNVILTAKDKEFARAMQRSQKQVARFASKSQRDLSKTSAAFGALKKAIGPLVAALGARALVNGLSNVVAAMDDIGKTADRIGITTDALQELRAVAESAGVEQGALDNSIEKLGKGLAEAAMGIGTAKYALDELNLSANDLMAMGLDGAMAEIADAVNDVSDPMQRTALATQLFGRSGAPMLNLLAEGSDGMARMRQEARDLGIVMDEDLIRGAEEAQTQLDLMKRVISAELSQAIVRLAPVLVKAAEGIAAVARGVGEFIDTIDRLITPSDSLELVIDNVTLAMGDQIRQTALLNSVMNTGGTMTRQMARDQLNLALARRSEYDAQKLQIQNSREYRQAQNAVNIAQQAMDHALGLENGEEYIALAQTMMDTALAARDALLANTGEMSEAFRQNEENIVLLQAALVESTGNVISLNGEVTNGIDLTDRLTRSAEAVAEATDSINFSNAVQGAVALAEQMGVTLHQAMMMKGLLGAASQAASSGVSFDPRDPNFDQATADEARRLSTLLRTRELMQGISAEATIQNRYFSDVSGQIDNVAASAGGARPSVQGLVEDIAQVSPALEALGLNAESLQGIMQKVEGSMESAFMSMVDGTQSAEDAFKAMGAEIIKELYRVLVVKRITGFITSAVGGFFNMNQVSGPAMPLGTGNISPPIRPRASGGTASAGNPYMTGEHGRELFVPQVNGRILSAAQTRNATSGGGGVSVVQNINISTGVAQTVRTEIRTLMPQIADAAKSAVVDAKLRGGSYGRSFG